MHLRDVISMVTCVNLLFVSEAHESWLIRTSAQNFCSALASLVVRVRALCLLHLHPTVHLQKCPACFSLCNSCSGMYWPFCAILTTILTTSRHVKCVNVFANSCKKTVKPNSRQNYIFNPLHTGPA